MWKQFRTPQRNQSNSAAATPDTAQNTPGVENADNNNSSINLSGNHFGALADNSSTSGGGASTHSEKTANAKPDDDSISTMSTTAEESCLISLKMLKSKMEIIKPGVTTTNNKPTHTDI